MRLLGDDYIISEFRDIILELEEKVLQLQGQLQKRNQRAKRAKTDAKTKEKSLLEQVVDLKDDVQDRDEQIVGLQTQVQDTSNDLNTANEDKVKLNTRIQELEAAAKVTAQQNQDVTKAVFDKDETIKQKDAALRELNLEKKETEARLEQTHSATVAAFNHLIRQLCYSVVRADNAKNSWNTKQLDALTPYNPRIQVIDFEPNTNRPLSWQAGSNDASFADVVFTPRGLVVSDPTRAREIDMAFLMYFLIAPEGHKIDPADAIAQMVMVDRDIVRPLIEMSNDLVELQKPVNKIKLSCLVTFLIDRLKSEDDVVHAWAMCLLIGLLCNFTIPIGMIWKAADPDHITIDGTVNETRSLLRQASLLRLRMYIRDRGEVLPLTTFPTEDAAAMAAAMEVDDAGPYIKTEDDGADDETLRTRATLEHQTEFVDKRFKSDIVDQPHLLTLPMTEFLEAVLVKQFVGKISDPWYVKHEGSTFVSNQGSPVVFQRLRRQEDGALEWVLNTTGVKALAMNDFTGRALCAPPPGYEGGEFGMRIGDNVWMLVRAWDWENLNDLIRAAEKEAEGKWADL